MSINTQNDVRTLAYVLKRTNYNEADRIINVITPKGKTSAIAKGVRREKSKLAGGIEMFSLVELNIHRGKGEIGVVTSAKMLKYYGNLMSDFKKMEFAALVLKKISLAAESSDNPEYFKIIDQSLACLNSGLNMALVESWFWLNLLEASGEEVNLYRDADGKKLSAECRYVWDAMDNAFIEKKNGDYGADEIKVLRLILNADLGVVAKIKDIDRMTPGILKLAHIVSKI
ncbi:DNA repair protein RecO [Candidatus Saccharibacteria bacterium]|nr:DNA repair protein RecO [Candidatus Saccharibacteria bacterium]